MPLAGQNARCDRRLRSAAALPSLAPDRSSDISLCLPVFLCMRCISFWKGLLFRGPDRIARWSVQAFKRQQRQADQQAPVLAEVPVDSPTAAAEQKAALEHFQGADATCVAQVVSDVAAAAVHDGDDAQSAAAAASPVVADAAVDSSGDEAGSTADETGSTLDEENGATDWQEEQGLDSTVSLLTADFPMQVGTRPSCLRPNLPCVVCHTVGCIHAVIGVASHRAAERGTPDGSAAVEPQWPPHPPARALRLAV